MTEETRMEEVTMIGESILKCNLVFVYIRLLNYLVYVSE